MTIKKTDASDIETLMQIRLEMLRVVNKLNDGESFMKIIDFMPWILKMEFDGKKFLSMEEVFHIQKEYKE